MTAHPSRQTTVRIHCIAKRATWNPEGRRTEMYHIPIFLIFFFLFLLLLAIHKRTSWVGGLEVLIYFGATLFTLVGGKAAAFALFHIPYERHGVCLAGLIWFFLRVGERGICTYCLRDWLGAGGGHRVGSVRYLRYVR